MQISWGATMQRLQHSKFLILLFILALPVFTWLRWNPTSWINAQLASNGMAAYVQVNLVEKSGMELRLKDVHIQIPDGTNISLNRVVLNPAWLRILRGTPSFHVRGAIGGATFSFNVSMQGGYIWLRDLDILARAGMIKDYFPQAAMLNLTGDMLISGDIKLRQHDGIPLEGAMTLQWQKAASNMLGKGSLGDFRLDLTSSKNSAWQWQVKGGKTLSIDGKGHLSTLSQNPELWQVDGSIHTQSQGSVASLLTGITGQDRWDLMISGVISNPHMKLLKTKK